MRALASCLAAGLIAALAATSPLFPSTATAASIGGFSVRPATFDAHDPLTRAYFRRSVLPGGSFQGAVVITNSGDHELAFYVSGVDGLTGTTSGAVYANRQDPVGRAGRWIALPESRVAVPAHAARTVTFTVTVPRTARPGDHLAGIAVEDAASHTSPGNFAIRQIVRAVVGVLVRVDGPASRHLRLGSVGLLALPGTRFASVVVGVHNDGRLLCKPRLSVTLAPAGGRPATVVRRLDTVLPATEIAYPLPWAQTLRPGDYDIAARATGCGPASTTRGTRHLGRTLTGSTHGLSAMSPATPSRWWLFVVVAVGGLCAGSLLSRVRRRLAVARSAR